MTPATVTAAPEGQVSVHLGAGRLTVLPLALRLQSVPGNGSYKLIIMNAPTSSGRQTRRGIWGQVSNAAADKLRALGVEDLETHRAPKLPKWEPTEFLIETSIGNVGNFREVLGVARGGYGVAQFYLDDDGAAILDEWRPRPPQTLTHLRTGLRVPTSSGLSLTKCKRLALELTEVAPRLAQVDNLRELPPEQLAAVKELLGLD